MRPIFTIHAGEYLVGSAIEKMFPKVRVWIPSKDDGIDLLVTDRKGKRAISLQVKFSKDYLGNQVKSKRVPGVKSGGWWSFDLPKMKKSKADFWVLVLYRFQDRDFDFVVVKPKALATMYSTLFPKVTRVQSYVWVTSKTSVLGSTRTQEVRPAGRGLGTVCYRRARSDRPPQPVGFSEIAVLLTLRGPAIRFMV
jgi:hypothetical protein